MEDLIAFRGLLQNNNIHGVKLFIKKNPNIVNMCYNGVSSLLAAIVANHISIARILLKNGANINFQTEDNHESALLFESKRGNIENIQLLLEWKADVNLRSLLGCSALYVAAQYNHIAIVRLLIKNNAELNLSTNTGHSPLHTAVERNHIDIIYELIEYGANINVCNIVGDNVLIFAIIAKNIKLIRYCIENGVDINQCNNEGYSPLYIAAKNNLIEETQLLIENGADINLRDHNEYSPLYIIVQYNNIQMAQKLLNNGANVNIRTAGFCPLFIAAQKGYIDMLNILILYGADITILCNNGHSVLYFAAIPPTFNNIVVISKLIENGAVINKSIYEDIVAHQKKYNNCNNLRCSKKTRHNTCSQCGIAMYCSVECQADSWKSHKKVCKIVKKYLTNN